MPGSNAPKGHRAVTCAQATVAHCRLCLSQAARRVCCGGQERGRGREGRARWKLTPQIPLSLSSSSILLKRVEDWSGDWLPPGLWCCVSLHEWMPSKPLFLGRPETDASAGAARRRGQARQSTPDTPPSRRACFSPNLSRGCADALQLSWCVTAQWTWTVAPQSPSRHGRFGSPPTWAMRNLPRAVWTLQRALAEVVAGECRRQSWLAGRRQREELLRPNCPRCPRCPRCQVRLVGRSGLDWKLGRKQLPARWVSSENSRRGHTPLRLILGREARWKRKYPSSQQYGRDRSPFGHPPAVAQPTIAGLSGAGGH